MESSPPPLLPPRWGVLDRAEAWLLAIPYTLTKNCPTSQPLYRQLSCFPIAPGMVPSRSRPWPGPETFLA